MKGHNTNEVISRKLRLNQMVTGTNHFPLQRATGKKSKLDVEKIFHKYPNKTWGTAFHIIAQSLTCIESWTSRSSKNAPCFQIFSCIIHWVTPMYLERSRRHRFSKIRHKWRYSKQQGIIQSNLSNISGIGRGTEIHEKTNRGKGQGSLFL